MPAVSKAQFRWLHTPSAREALGSAGVSEWLSATGSPSSLPERKSVHSAVAGALMRRRQNGQGTKS